MFLSELSTPQKSTFVALMTRIVLADGKVQEEENVLLDSMRAEMGAPPKAPAEELFGRVNADNFESDPRAKYIALFEIMVMSYADDTLHKEENRVVEEVRTSFHIPADDQEKLKALAREQAEITMEALTMAGFHSAPESTSPA